MLENKVKNYFHHNKDIILKRKEIVSLSQERRTIFDNLKNLIAYYNDNLDLKKLGDWTNRLPFEDLYELSDIKNGLNKDSLDVLKERIKIKKKYDKEKDIVEILEHKIKESQFDLLLAKISCVEEKLNN